MNQAFPNVNGIGKLSYRQADAGILYTAVPSLKHYMPCNEADTQDTDEADVNDVVGNLVFEKDHISPPPPKFTWNYNPTSVNFSPTSLKSGSYEDFGTGNLIVFAGGAFLNATELRFGDSDTNSHIKLDGDGCQVRDTGGTNFKTADPGASGDGYGFILDRDNNEMISFGWNDNSNAIDESVALDITTLGTLTVTAGAIGTGGTQAAEQTGIAFLQPTAIPVNWRTMIAWTLYQWSQDNRVFHPWFARI